jgi:hypothetical protein
MSANILDEHRPRPCALQMDVAFSPEMLVVTYQKTRCANPDEHTLGFDLNCIPTMEVTALLRTASLPN